MTATNLQTLGSNIGSRTLAATTGIISTAHMSASFLGALGSTPVTWGSLASVQVAAPLVVAAGGGIVAGRIIGHYGSVYDKSKNKWVSIDQWVQDRFAPMMKLPDDGDPILEIRKWCKEQGFNYTDVLSKPLNQ
jgi:hypothetical protein